MIRSVSAPARLARRVSPCAGVLTLTLSASVSLPANADDASSLPDHPVYRILPYAAGGLPETVPRIVVAHLTNEFSQSAIVDRVVTESAFVERTIKLGIEPIGGSPTQYQKNGCRVGALRDLHPVPASKTGVNGRRAP